MGSESVTVVVRCRPLNARERALGSCVVLSVDLHRCQCFIEKPGAADEPPKRFTFDGTYFLDQTTEQMYNEAAYSLVEVSRAPSPRGRASFGVTRFYLSRGSRRDTMGRSSPMDKLGVGSLSPCRGCPTPQPRGGSFPEPSSTSLRVFSQCAENTKFLVRASYLEIYNEEIRDLLGSDTKHRLELKEHPERGVYARDLSMHAVHSVGGCERMLERGRRNRAVGCTLMNKDSSRSHSIFTIHLEIYNTDAGGQDRLRAAKLNLVDLAGSERQSKTGATGERLREATKINLSLSALGNVISALVDGRSKHVPYRDSKLTRLLQDSLGGNTRTLMIACLSPADNNYEESLSTLRYANRAKSIQNRPRINQDPKDALLREYQEEIEKLRALLSGKLGTAELAPLLAGPSCEASPAVPSRPQSTNTEAVKIKEATAEYEVRLAKLQAEYNAEQESKAKLQEDIAALRSSFESEPRASGGGCVSKNAHRLSSPQCNSSVSIESETERHKGCSIQWHGSSASSISASASSSCVTEELCPNHDPLGPRTYGETAPTKPTVPERPDAYARDAAAAAAAGPPDQQRVLESRPRRRRRRRTTGTRRCWAAATARTSPAATSGQRERPICWDGARPGDTSSTLLPRFGGPGRRPSAQTPPCRVPSAWSRWTSRRPTLR
ncbi:kinesin-like protein KIF17 isoform 2-T4 [Spinachia spinachia]